MTPRSSMRGSEPSIGFPIIMIHPSTFQASSPAVGLTLIRIMTEQTRKLAAPSFVVFISRPLLRENGVSINVPP